MQRVLRRSWSRLSLLCVGLAGLAGCGSDGASRKEPGPAAGLASTERPYRPGQMPVARDEEREADGLAVEGEHGTLEQRDVDAALDSARRALVACYDRAGEARQYASGQVTLRFFIGKSGAVRDVLVKESTLGNYAVERCLVAESRKIKLPPTGGQKEADFEYSLAFRSTGEVSVTEWDADLLAEDIGGLATTLSGCGALGPEPARAVVYIKPGGRVASVGLSSEAALEPLAVMCVLGQINGWTLRDDARQMVRTSFVVPDAPGLAEAPREKKKPHLAKRLARRSSRARR